MDRTLARLVAEAGKKMKLLMLGDASNRHTLRWADYFAEGGHQVHLASLEAAGPTRAVVHQLIAPRLPRAVRYLYAVPEVKRLADKIGPDLVNAHFLPNYGWLACLARLNPLALSVWGSDVLISAQNSFLHRARARYVLARSLLVTCDGGNLVQSLKQLGVESSRVLNIPMGVEEGIISLRNQSWTAGGPVRVSSVRQLEPVYDVETLVLALSELGGLRDKTLVAIAGSGSRAVQLRTMVERAGLSPAVEFRGSLSHDELITLLQDTDIYISTSLSDSTSVSLLEAMACGCVPVVTDIPGNREWIENGRNGYLFRPGDHLALSGELKKLINNPPDIPAIRRANTDIIRQRALWRNNMTMVERAFFGAINGRQ